MTWVLYELRMVHSKSVITAQYVHDFRTKFSLKYSNQLTALISRLIMQIHVSMLIFISPK